MINPVTGELSFDELILKPHQLLDTITYPKIETTVKKNNPVEGFTTIFPPIASNEYGQFELQLTFDYENRLVLITICHQNDFYEPDTENDSERRTYHDSIVAKKLSGQREFSWGEVVNFFCEDEGVDHLVVIYTPGSHVALHPSIPPLELKQAKRFD